MGYVLMPGQPGRSGGKRAGAGRPPLRTRYTITRPAAIFLRELARNRLGREVSYEDMGAVLSAVIEEYARSLVIPDPPN
jgi:hypothetical protein